MRLSKLVATVLLLITCVTAEAETEAPITVLEGHVARVMGVGAFVLSHSSAQTVIYYRATADSRLAPGEQLRVIGTPVDDWMGMGELEIQAQTVDRIGDPNQARFTEG